MTRAQIYFSIVLLLLVGLACATPSISMFDESAFNTSVAQTVVVGLTRNYMSPTFTLEPTITFTPTLTSEIPIFTDTPTQTITPTFPFTPTATNTPLIPFPDIRVSVNTNCRSGPGKVFDVEGTLLVDETVKVFGIDPTGQYWYIGNPDPGDDYCWLSGKYASVDGAVSLVPVMTPPSTPTATVTLTPSPGFTLTYSSIDGCGDWWIDLIVYNSGQASFNSMYLTLKDNFKGGTGNRFSNDFVNLDKCDGKTQVDSLAPGYSAIISLPPLTFNPVGKKLTLTAILCTELDLGGDCLTKEMVINLKNPKP